MAKSERPLDEAYLTALRALTELFESTRTPYVVVGGLAVTLIAKPRFTEDIDAVVWLEPEVWPDMLKQARLHGFVPRSQRPLEFAAQTNMLLLRHGATGVEIDLSCGALPFEREIIERAQAVELPGMTVRVVTPEDLIVTKGVALREQDVADIKTVIDVNKKL
ncbi:MAG TPA: nucleotidyl transferase AbiEii/AbiGii toxin family protein, partial [Pyrinomonadaceae bacterium]|nr:nucleotidyl transferase AbiEii/AbiGii toxin family protein [Pyrinomonadaceae bacterium]